ncbi:TVP38/TMEM64 family protein [Bacillus suaedaesalsae]|uniref:TVP38/TMEM64 family membrane protein n=1 Tax=Bacillus suaedaesalsae TaxID=2810349 RepID=A0ABS2DGC6_9BACI|nr:VTT domain-containing protein [Bacillus suaedaesalsae]MBM6617515.1 TVP38/TMEM64 family protein [Bacillus suaedaesalsae]
MSQSMTMLFAFLESSGFWAPFVFLLFHSIRQFLFIPVAVLCVIGGILFGTILGTIYSLTGLTISCILFYFLYQSMPKLFNKIHRMKDKWIGNRLSFTPGQIALLRCIPFMQYNLLSLILLERKKNLFSYTKQSFLTNIPVAVLYTLFGQSISRLSPTLIIIILCSMTIMFYMLREKQIYMKWKEFFPEKAA